MTEYWFRIRFQAPDVRSVEIGNQLYEAGCDDATTGAEGEIGFASFARQAPSLEQAITTAIRQMQSVEGVQVLDVEIDQQGLRALPMLAVE